MLGTSRYRWSLTPASFRVWYLCSVIRRSKFRYQEAPPVHALESIYLTTFIKNVSSLHADRCPQGCWEHSDWHRWTDPGGAQLWCSQPLLSTPHTHKGENQQGNEDIFAQIWNIPRELEMFCLEMMKSETLCLCDCHMKGSGGIDS